MPKFDIAIIGAGISGISVVKGAVEEAVRSNKKLRIALIDAQKEITGGIPWNKNQDQIFLSNGQAYGQTLGEDQDMLAWVDHHPEIAKQFNIKVTKGENGYHIDRPYPPRALFGTYAAAKLEEIIEIASTNGIEVSLILGQHAKQLNKSGNHWQTKLSNGNTVVSRQTVLAIGDLSSDIQGIEEEKNYYSSPYTLVSEKEIREISKKATVGIIGTSLVFMDTVRALADSGHTGVIYASSSSGTIPVVKAKKSRPYQLKYLTPESLLQCQTLTIQYVLDLFCKEVAYCLGKEGKSFDLKRHLETLADKITKEFIQNEIEQVEKYDYRDYQPMLDKVYYDIFPIICKRFSVDEQKKLWDSYYRPFMQHGAGVPLENGYILRNKIMDGSLQIIKGFKKVEKNDSGFTFTTTSGSFDVDVVINASGAGKQIKTNSLLMQMEQSGYVKPHPVGGLCADINSGRVINSKGEIDKSLFAVGPITFGNCPNPYDIEMSVKNGNQVGAKATQASISIAKEYGQIRYFQLPKQDRLKEFAYLDLAVSSYQATLFK